MELKYWCQRCGEELDPTTMAELELNTHTGLYSDPAKGPLPQEDSQGLFSFGIACAKAVLKNGGKCTSIRDRKRWDR